MKTFCAIATVTALGLGPRELSAQIQVGPGGLGTGGVAGGGVSTIVTDSQFGQGPNSPAFAPLSLSGSQFGPRLDNSPFSAPSQRIGALRTGSRFDRRARRRGQFVGSDAREQQSFVGAVQGATNPTGVSAASGVTANPGPSAASVNRRRQPSAASTMYDPVLVVAFDVPHTVPKSVAEGITWRMSRLSNLQGCQVSVRVDGRIAVIQGTVGSDQQSRFVERYVQMEPGISAVDNRLQFADPRDLHSENSPREVLPAPPVK